MKTIFFIIRNPHRINAVLRTDLFKILKAKNYRIVIVSEFGGDKNFVEEFKGPNIFFEPLIEMGRISQMLSFWREQAFQSKHPDIQFAIMTHSGITKGIKDTKTILTRVKVLIRKIILSILPHNEGFWDWLENIFISAQCAEDLIATYHPNAVLVTTAGNEKAFLLACKKYGILSINIDSNIDAPQLRYFSKPRETSKWAVFGESLKQEFIRLHNIPKNQLTVTGALRYDYFFKEFKPKSREEFLKQIHADPSKKLITYAAKVSTMYPYNDVIIKEILTAIEKGELVDAQLFVRFDPGHDIKQYGKLLDSVLWEQADLGGDYEHVANLLYHSDVTTSIASTFNCESAIFDTPSIWIGFDGYDKESRITHRHHELKVFADIIDMNAVRFAESPTELIKLLKGYLLNPAQDRAARSNMLEQYYYKKDGKTGERIVHFIETHV